MRQLFVFLALAFVACAPSAPPQPERTQLEIRQMQTREYDRPKGGTTRVMKAVINSLQDDGFIIQNADKDLGFITAEKESDIEDRWESFFARLGAAEGQPARFRKNNLIECSVSVSEFGKNIRVRSVFKHKVLDNLGGTLSVSNIDEPSFYQEFFSKVDKGIFIDRQGL